MKKWNLKGGLLILLLGVGTFACDSSKDKNETKPATKSKVINVVENAEPVLGIDVSHFQGDVNWQEIKNAGISFVYSKATQGATYHDPKFKRNWQDSRQHELYRGAYHFYEQGIHPLKQAKHFISVVEVLEAGDLPPVLDLEQASLSEVGVKDVKLFQENVLIWLSEVEKHFGIRPIIYTNHPFGDAYLKDPRFSEYKLWIAEYGISKPRIPKVWDDSGWVFWQRSERGKIEGAIGDVDHDILNGDLNTLKSLLKEDFEQEASVKN